MSRNMSVKVNISSELGKPLLAEFGRLWAEADSLWDRHHDTPAFYGYASADYLAVYESLVQLRGTVRTVLEWGSGLGIVTIMASRLGFEAYGIEAEAELINYSESLAQAYSPNARFAQGNFIPDDFDWSPEYGEVNRTRTGAASAYDKLGLELKDFDLVYAYPWPKEYTFYRNVLLKFGRRDALFLRYDARDGTKLVVLNDSTSPRL
jgi:hypothetical protein